MDAVGTLPETVQAFTATTTGFELKPMNCLLLTTMSGAKITLSDAALALFANADIILTKNHILQQTGLLLAKLQHQMLEKTKLERSTHCLFTIAGKISRGENYQGLPWLVLDYPRQFGNPDTFAIRSFFWWGHFYSSTLQLAGSHALQHRAAIMHAQQLLAANNYYLHTGPDPWAHHFEPGNYTPISSLDAGAFAVLLHREAPIKIAAKWPLEQWHLAANNLWGSWELLLRICSI